MVTEQPSGPPPREKEISKAFDKHRVIEDARLVYFQTSTHRNENVYI